MPLDSVTVSALTSELRAQLVGGKIDKVQQPERDTVLLSIRSPLGNVRLAICGGVGNRRAIYRAIGCSETGLWNNSNR